MSKLQPVIKWTGSKRSQAETILSYFPKVIKTYYEPFVGGGSVMFRLINSDIKVEEIICSDINSDLISLWNEIKNNPNDLIESYEAMWSEMNNYEDVEKRKEYFYKIRERFNKDKNPHDFLFLSRTCTKGLIRYNSKGEFNTSLHFSRKGIEPKTLEKIIKDWSEKLIASNVIFLHRNYEEIKTNEGDLLYLDPPYPNSKGVYFGTIDYEKFWTWVRKQKGDYLLSFNGRRDDIDNTYDVPKDIYKSHIYLKSGRSSFKDLRQQQNVNVEESLYINTKGEKINEE